MAVQSAVKTRIQLKNDTEAHWNLAANFVPLKGELIIYSADETHPFCRFKVGDGVTNIINLPFSPGNSGGGGGSIDVLNHTLTFGANQAFTFDGSRDVVVPVYMGAYSHS